MNRGVRSLILGSALALATAGTAVAAPAADPFPEADGWEAVDITIHIPAGVSCDVAVDARIVGHERVRVNGEAPSGDPQVGDLIVIESPDETLVLTNTTKRNKSVFKSLSGTFYDRVVDFGHDGVLDERSTGVGSNLYTGPGVKGLVWTKGVTHARITNFQSNERVIDILRTNGKTVELCHKVGARAVPGQPLPPGSIEDNLA